MKHITIDAGTLLASNSDRTVTGVLVPYGEQCRSNVGMFSVDPGVITIPQDLTGMSMNVEHQREDVIGAPVQVTETPAGIVAAFSIANTPEGDAALADIRSGKRRHLSAEIKNVKTKNGKATSGTLFASALVARPAFPGATLLAAAADDESDEVVDPEATEDTGTHEMSEYVDENGVTWRRVVDTDTTTNGDTQTTVTTITEEVTDPNQTDPEEEEDNVPQTATAMLAAKKTAAGQRARTAPRPAAPAIDLGTVFAGINAVRMGADPSGQTLLAALSTIKTNGALKPGHTPPNWMGPLWDGRTYDRRFISLHNLGTDISLEGKTGYKVARGTKASPKERIGGDWAGNLTEVPSGEGFVDTFASKLHRFAVGNQIAREYTDLPGGEAVVEAFLKLLVEDYAMWSDDKALAAMLTAAGTVVAPRAVPERYSDSPALGQLIQGALGVQRKRDTPTYAVVNEVAYDQLMFTPKDLVPEYVSFEFSTELSGTADAGKLVVVQATDAQFVNAAGNAPVDLTKPATLVGAKNAITFDELGSTPLNVDAMEIAKGGVDRAAHGYLQEFVERPESLMLIGTAAAAG